MGILCNIICFLILLLMLILVMVHQLAAKLLNSDAIELVPNDCHTEVAIDTFIANKEKICNLDSSALPDLADINAKLGQMSQLGIDGIPTSINDINADNINSLFENPDLPFRRFNLQTEPEVTDFYRIDPRRQLQQFGLHRVVIYRVNPEYAALYETAGSSTLSITAPPSNIENGRGIFTGVSSDTLYFEVKKL